MASKRLRAFNSDSGEELKVDMSPMIDMVFLLLIFFIVNASIVIVKQDKNVNIPIANPEYSAEQKVANGRIVVNIYEDGSVSTEKGSDELFEEGDDAGILDYLEKRRKEEELLSYTPILNLRGDQAALFKHARRVIRIGGNAGIKKINFTTYGTDK